MLDETNISPEKKWFYQEQARMAVASLNRRNIVAQSVPNRQEALAVILGMIPAGAVVGRGDSVTMDQIGVLTELRKRNQNTIIDPFESHEDGSWFMPDSKQRRGAARQALLSDVFLSGTNAVTLDGKLVNIDGGGNRVSALIFGPDKVIIACGANKIVKDVNAALERIHTVAAPVNAKRHFLEHHGDHYAELPCVKTGRCVDCNHDWRVCRYTVIIEGTLAREKGRINVVLIEEELGI